MEMLCNPVKPHCFVSSLYENFFVQESVASPFLIPTTIILDLQLCKKNLDFSYSFSTMSNGIVNGTDGLESRFGEYSTLHVVFTLLCSFCLVVQRLSESMAQNLLMYLLI